MRRPLPVLVLVVLVLTLGACGSSDKVGSDATTTSAPNSVTTASTPTYGGKTYSTKAFVVPFTVEVPATLESPPKPDSPNLLSWAAAASPDNAVRFLVPVELYRPGTSTPEAPPDNYLEYLRGQANAGADISAPTKITVGGHPATLMNVTSTIDAAHPGGFLDGALGCPEPGGDQADDCFGPQPDLLLRLAVVEVGDTTLLTWARVNKVKPDQAFLTAFERMLTTVQFR